MKEVQPCFVDIIFHINPKPYFRFHGVGFFRLALVCLGFLSVVFFFTSPLQESETQRSLQRWSVCQGHRLSYICLSRGGSATPRASAILRLPPRHASSAPVVPLAIPSGLCFTRRRSVCCWVSPPVASALVPLVSPILALHLVLYLLHSFPVRMLLVVV